MKKRKPPHPTPSELRILSVLWRRGPSTVRQVYEEVDPERAGAYTGTLKFLQVMYEKGFVRRDESRRSHVYEAAVGEADVARLLVRDLRQRLFGGSTKKLVMAALSEGRVSRDQLAEIHAFIESLQRKA